MLCLVLLVSVINFYNLASCMFYKSNTTDLSKCNVSYSRTGSTYKDFYPLSIHENESNGSLILDFHFAVLAASDAHILLAETDNVSKNDPAYEIVIGAGGNTFCDIRRMQKSDVRHSVRLKGLLSALDPHFFWLHITKVDGGGLIQVGKEGKNTSFIDWLDPEFLPVKFISFSTWSGIEAKWYFNCDRSQNQEELERRLTAMDKLRRNLLLLYDPMVRPVADRSTITQVSMSVNLEYLDLDEYKLSIEISGTTTMRWRDEKLTWNPKNYDNITEINVARKEIWKPEITCYSAIDNPTDVLQDGTVVVNNRGQISSRPALHVKSLCDDVQLGDWPRDIHTCKVLFGFSMDNGNIMLTFNDSDSNLLHHGTSQWVILEATLFEIETDNVTADTPSFGLYFEVKRSSSLYNTVFFTPFIVIAICLLLSFWIPPNSHMKIPLGSSQLIMEIIMLLALAHFVPRLSGGVPFLVILYITCLVGSLISLILGILVTTISRKRQPKPLHHIVRKILTMRFVKAILWLPNIVMPEDYGDLEISLSSSNLSRTEDRDHHFWILLGIAIDRISFLIYTPLIVLLIIKYIVLCS